MLQQSSCSSSSLFLVLCAVPGCQSRLEGHGLKPFHGPPLPQQGLWGQRLWAKPLTRAYQGQRCSNKGTLIVVDCVSTAIPGPIMSGMLSMIGKNLTQTTLPVHPQSVA